MYVLSLLLKSGLSYITRELASDDDLPGNVPFNGSPESTSSRAMVWCHASAVLESAVADR